MNVFLLDFIVAGAAALILGFDAFIRVPGRYLGWFTAFILLATFAASFVLDVSGTTPHGVYVSSEWVLYFKRDFLIAGALGVLGSIDWLEEHTPHRQWPSSPSRRKPEAWPRSVWCCSRVGRSSIRPGHPRSG
jgi:hypothetical protein